MLHAIASPGQGRHMGTVNATSSKFGAVFRSQRLEDRGPMHTRAKGNAALFPKRSALSAIWFRRRHDWQGVKPELNCYFFVEPELNRTEPY